MTPGYRTRTATGSGRESARSLHWLTLAAVLVILLSAVAPGVWTHGAGVARAQDEVAAGDVTPPGQVIAQGIARLPRGDLAWTVRTIAATGDERTTVASFPVGFVVADGATIAVLDEQGDVLNLLEDGEAAFLPNGKAGALASWEDEASLYEVALVSAEEASAGETPGTVAGNPFAAPQGTTFDIEIARTVLARDDQTTIPISPSGAPVLYLQTAGAAQLQAGESQPVELAAGQFAMLLGDVTARGASDEPATFLVAAIGEETAERDGTKGTPEARASRENRQRVGDTAASDGAARARRARRVRTGGGGGQGSQTAPQGTGGTGAAPVSGAVTPPPLTEAPAGTPPAEPTVEATLPVETTVPDEGTPPPDATIPPEDEVPGDATETPDPAAPPVDGVPTEEPAGEPLPTVEVPPGEETPPGDEVPAEDPPVDEEPVAEPTAEA